VYGYGSDTDTVMKLRIGYGYPFKNMYGYGSDTVPCIINLAVTDRILFYEVRLRIGSDVGFTIHAGLCITASF
jgi:hypothetical protein